MEYFYAIKLTVKAAECEMIFYGTRKHPTICMNQASIDYKKSYKYVGFHLDRELKLV